jgi:uncharacterized NAD(P)/FAD-binding protein YdhS
LTWSILGRLAVASCSVPPDDFVPRELVGRYCGDAFREHATGIEHRHVASRAVRVARHGAGYRIDLADGERLTADAVVVATGTGPVSGSWYSTSISTSPRPASTRSCARTGRLESHDRCSLSLAR